MPLITSDDLVAYLGLNRDVENEDRLQVLVDTASDALCKRLGRDFVQTNRTDVVVGNKQKYLVLKHYPVKVVTAITIKTGTTTQTVLNVNDPTIVDLVNPSQGILMRTDGNVWDCAEYRNITITYVGGPESVPGYVKGAALEIAAYLYQTTGGRSSVRSGDTSVVMASLVSKDFRDLPAVMEAVILAGDVLA